MRNQLLETKEFYILSRSIDNATKCQVINVKEDCFEIKLEQFGVYEIDESVELFAMTEKGQLYFETIVKAVNDDVISLWFPLTYKYLQRREYSRISIDKEITLLVNDKKVKAKIIDISAGGLKLETKEQLNLLSKYAISIKVENQNIKCSFEPNRIEFEQGKFISSGRFIDITNYDRIALVQYCFKKQIENNNK